MRVEYPRIGKGAKVMWVLVCQEKAFEILSECIGKPLRVRSRELCELIHILGYRGEEANMEERGRKGAYFRGHILTYSHTLTPHPSPFPHLFTDLQEDVCRETAGMCAG